jgi:glycosyltransferase involved in cell wall biosynthesis
MTQANGRCAFVILRLNSGGAERQLAEIAKGLARRGRSVTVLTLARSMPGYVEALSVEGVEVVECGQGEQTDAASVMRALRTLRARRPSSVVGFMTHGNLVSRLSRLAGGRARVINSFRVGLEKAVPRLLYRGTPWLCDVDVPNSQSAADSLRAQKVVRPTRLRVIPNGIDIRRFAPDPGTRSRLRQEFGWNNHFVWLMVAVMRAGSATLNGGMPQKRFDLLLDAFAALRVDHPRARLAIVGDGPLRPQVEAQIRSLDLTESVRLLGARTDINVVMNLADAKVLATDYEGMPNALLEAHAAGLPVVASAVAGVLDVVEDGVTGFLAASGNAPALRNAMVRMMSLPPMEHERMRADARRRALAFSFEYTIERWSAVLDERPASMD